MATTTTPEAPAARRGYPGSSWRGLIVLIAVVAVAIVGLGVWLLVADDERTPTDVVQDIARGIRTDDMALLEEVSGTDELWFYEWQIALRAEPEFTNCTELAAGPGTQVTCDVTTGDEFFYTQIVGETFTTRIMGTVHEDGTFTGTSFPPPASETSSLEALEAELRTWVQATYPDLDDDLYGGNPGYIGLTMTRESGELRMDLLDEFLASRQ